MTDAPLVARVASVLDARNVSYALIGAAALAAHGVARSTFDLDLFTTEPDVLHAATWTELVRDAGVRLTIRRGDAEDPLLGVVCVEADGERDVDLVVGRWSWQAAAVARARRFSISGVSMPVIDAADLVLFKLYAGGSQDCWDIQQLLAGGDRESLIAVVESRLAALPTEARQVWQRLARGR